MHNFICLFLYHCLCVLVCLYVYMSVCLWLCICLCVSDCVYVYICQIICSGKVLNSNLNCARWIVHVSDCVVCARMMAQPDLILFRNIVYGKMHFVVCMGHIHQITKKQNKSIQNNIMFISRILIICHKMLINK